MPTFDAPQLDGQVLEGTNFAQAETFYAPQLIGQFGRGASLLVDPVEPFTMEIAGNVVADTFARTFTEQLNDIGSFSFSMLRDDYLASSITFDDEVVFTINGLARFRGVISDIAHDPLAAGEEADQIVILSGLGLLGALRGYVVMPSRGVGVLPIEDVRTFSWVGADYETTVTNWSLAKIVNFRSDYADTDAPRPDIWPNINGRWIWGNVPGVNSLDAPQGINLFRRTITLGATTLVRFFYAGDNVMRLWIDGAEITWFAGSRIGEYVEIEMTEGDHVIAAKVANKVDVPGQDNPAGFIFAGYAVGPDGLMDGLVIESNTTWRCMPYPIRAPGFSVGKVIRLLFEDYGITDWELDFTDNVDSAGQPWTYQREITLNVGRTYTEVMRELMAVHADIAVAPGGRILRAWNRGTRGQVRSTTLQQTDEPETSDFLSLKHSGTATRMTQLLIRYADGHTLVGEEGPIGYIEAGHITDEDVAREYGLAVLENRDAPSFSTQASLHPATPETTPYTGFEVGDWINCPNEENDDESMRVASILWTEDQDGAVDWDITLRDVRMEIDDRQQVALTRMADGTAVGGAHVSSRKETPQSMSKQITVLTVAEFSFDNTLLVVSRSPIRPAEISGNIVEVFAELTTAGTTDTEIVVHMGTPGSITGGVISGTVLATLVFPPGVTSQSAAVDLFIAKANLHRVQVEIQTAGDGAEGLDLQVRAI